MTEEQKAVHFETLQHVREVQKRLNHVIAHLIVRGETHDATKLLEPEMSAFARVTPLMKGTEYGSPEYRAQLASIRPAIDHHNAHSRHHPEHFENGVWDMTLIDVTEMVCDWCAAALRNRNGNILKSAEKCFERFEIDDQLAAIIMNTIRLIESRGVTDESGGDVHQT